MSRIHANNFATIIDGAIDDDDLALDLLSITGFPSIGAGVTCNLTLQSGSTIEIITATAISTNTLTIERAQENTTAVSWADGSSISIRPTADSVDRKEDLISGATYSNVGTPAPGDLILLQDVSAGGALKTAYFSIFGGGGGGSLSDGDYGDITVSSSGTVINVDNDAITYAKMQNVSATDKLLGRSTSGSGDVEEITCTAAGRALLDDAAASDQRTTLGLGTLATQSGTFSGTSSGTNTGDQTNITGNAATVTTNANLTGPVTSTGNTTAIANGAISNAMLANSAVANLSGTNTGDQTSIVGLTGSKAQFDTACTDGNFLYSGDVTQYTDELAQDAVGAMVDTTIVYVDATPLLTRAALTGDVTAAQASNATTVVLPSSATVAVDDKVYIFDTSASDAKKYVTTQSIADLALTFKTIAISGQSDVVADSGTDTLTLVAGSNITLTTNASTDTITIASSGSGGGMTMNAASGTTQAAAVNNGYICTNAAQCNVTLPATAAVGDLVKVVSQGAGGIKVTANTGQTVKGLGDTTTSAGSVTPAAQYDSIQLICVVANTTWVIDTFVSSLLTFA